MAVNTSTKIKKAGVKRALKTGGKYTGKAVGKVFQWILNILLTLLLVAALTGIVVGIRFYKYVDETLIEEDYDINDLKTNLEQTTKIYYTGADGNPIELEDERIHGAQNRSWVGYNQMPKMLVDAFLAIEDERFWTNGGVDWKRTFGALLQFAGGNDSYGGSTITQQLIKNVTREDETTIQRKIREIFRAISLTKKHSKQEIIEMYLNTINLSHQNYGVQAAANYYFGKDVSELTLVECAALASIPKSPTKYDPIRNPEFNKERRNVVLDKMSELGWITEEECANAHNEPLVINVTVLDGTVSKSNSYFKDALIEQLIDDLSTVYGYPREIASNIVYSGGLEIYTTMDPEIQTIMEEVFADPTTFQRVSDGVQPEAAMVIMDYRTGDVKGIVGGREKTGDRDLNRATMSKRQVGSSIKPLTVYAPAMDLGLINYSTVFDDTPVEYKPSLGRYWPQNSPAVYNGLVTVNQAIIVSKNTVAAKVLKQLTPEYSYTFAKNKLHLDSLVETDINLASLALGGLTNGLTVMEMTAAYSIFPNEGTYTAPRLYTRVLRSDGTVLLEKPVNTEQAISPDTAQVMTKILTNVVANGTASSIRLKNQINVAGKTGTTNDEKDRYFVGFTPYYVGACWFGYDMPKYLGKFSGNPAMIAWEKVMTRVHQKYIDDAAAGVEPLKTFDFSRLTTAPYCLDSGLIPGPDCTADRRDGRIATGWYTKNNMPSTTCDRHFLVNWDSSTGLPATEYCPKEFVMKVAYVDGKGRDMPGIVITDAAYVGTPGSVPGSMYDAQTCQVHASPVVPADEEPEITEGSDVPDVTGETEPGTDASAAGETGAGPAAEPGTGELPAKQEQPHEPEPVDHGEAPPDVAEAYNPDMAAANPSATGENG